MSFKILKNQNGFSVLEVLIAAGISTTVALTSMRISTNNQKAMRKAIVDSDISSFFSITLRNALSSNDECTAAFSTVGSGLTIGQSSNTLINLSLNNVTITEGQALPGFETEFEVKDIIFQRTGDITCRLGLDLERINQENKLGARTRVRFVPISCGYDTSDNLTFCSSIDNAGGSSNSIWEKGLDNNPAGQHWAKFIDSNFASVIIGDDTGVGPSSKFTITTPDTNANDWQSGTKDGISLMNGNAIRWSGSPLTATSSGPGIVATDDANDCISFYGNSNQIPLKSCATGNSKTEINSSTSLGIDFQKQTDTASYTGIKSYLDNSMTAPSYSSQFKAIEGVAGTSSINRHGYWIGVRGVSVRTNPDSKGRAYGVQGIAGNAFQGNNFGVYGKVQGSNDGAGVYGCNNANCSESLDGEYAGYFDGPTKVEGDLEVTGEIKTNVWTTASVLAPWSHYSDLELQYMVDPMGFVHWRGGVTCNVSSGWNNCGQWPSSSKVINLPAVIDYPRALAAYHCISRFNSGLGKCAVHIYGNAIHVFTDNTTPVSLNKQYIMLDGISWKID